MTAVRKLQKCQQDNKSMICLGLDLDPKRMPSSHSSTVKGMFDFAHKVIDATSDLVCAYKPNLAFYESLGAEGISLLKLITERIPEHIPIILDGKRGDIGNTASHYATFLFEKLRGDWVTLNPYMGYDSMRPFLEHKDKGVFILCLTSNSGSKDFQMLEVDGVPLYRVVAEKVNYWNKEHNCGLVVGATHPEQLDDIRQAAGEMPLLIPGVGAQGGALEKAVMSGTDSFRKLAVINVSRSVLYASNDQDFAQRARQELEKLNKIVNEIREGNRDEDPGSEQSENARQPQPVANERSEQPSPGSQSAPPTAEPPDHSQQNMQPPAQPGS
ncbi:orotidine-5'-phosphate decarboxylase [bacterium]|nr:orotidine-5'-phosphate decarboxylase [bacterium]